MSFSDFPKWAPADVVQLLRGKIAEREQERQQSIKWLIEDQAKRGQPIALQEAARTVDEWRESEGPGEIELLHELLTNQCMKEAWASLSKIERPSRWSASVQENFARAAVIGFMGPVGHQKKTPAERDKWLSEIKETARRLAELVHASEFDGFLIREHQRRVTRAILADAARVLVNKEPVGSGGWPRGPGYLSDTLRALVAKMPELERAALTERPGGVEARRTHFVRFLTNHLRDNHGKPLRRVVLLTTMAAFDDENLTERQIIRLAP